MTSRKSAVARFELSTESTIKEIYSHFKKAKDDDSLDHMLEGVKKKLFKLNCDDKEKQRILNNIWIAYGNRQEDFDGHGDDSRNVIAQRVETIERAKPAQSAEDKLSEALRSLYQGDSK